MEQDIKRIIVHDGTFHADDVLSVAILKALYPYSCIERMSFPELPQDTLDDTIIVDIGFGQFDHHQVGSRIRSDGRKHAACGLVLEAFGSQLFHGNIPEEFIVSVRNIEDYDNKYSDASEHFLCEYVRLCNPEWDEPNKPADMYAAFISTVESVYEHYLKPFFTYSTLPTEDMDFFHHSIQSLRVKHSNAEERAEKMLEVAYENSNRFVVILDERLPWYHFLIPRETIFVINPSNRGGFHLQCIPKAEGSNSFKRYLPGSWLQAPPEGCTFVHSKLFLASFRSMREAETAAFSLLQEGAYFPLNTNAVES